MNYYIISTSNDLKIIGHYPQTTLAKGFNPVLNNGHRNVKKHELPDFTPNYEIDLHPKSNALNYLPRSGASFGVVIDGRTKELFEKFKLPPHRFYPMKVHHNSKVLDYFWYHHITGDYWDYIDKESSYGEIVSITMEHKAKIHKRFPLLSREQVLEEIKGLHFTFSARIGEVIMKKDFPMYDLYEIGSPGGQTIVSETLRDAIINEGLTGFDFKLIDRFKVFTSLK